MEDEQENTKASKGLPIVISFSAASILGSVLFALTYTGVFFGHNSDPVTETKDSMHQEADIDQSVEFLPIEPLLISLGTSGSGKQLRFEAYLEIQNGEIEETRKLMPRIMDVLNTYLRALDYADVEEPSSLLHLRLQMLKRVQIVVGEGRVSDLLISKFVLS